MPIYEYKCQECGKVTEIFVRSLHKKIDLFCSHCNSKNLQKIFSTPSVVRVGSSPSKGLTCCGETERCETPPCSEGGVCRKD
ncbi:MAG: zinc ribbon domain-containing protein [Candidatus Aminicenantaceae bacterium]